MRIAPIEKFPWTGRKFFSERARRLVRRIIEDVRRRGDVALFYWSRQFDGAEPSVVLLDKGQRGSRRSFPHLKGDIRQSFAFAAENLRAFCREQLKGFRELAFPIGPGVILHQRIQPVESVAVYIPAGRKPLISSLLMGVIPAQVAGVREIVVASPPWQNGRLHPLIEEAARMLGVCRAYVMGGAQAMAALAYGTEMVRPVDKIVGPGNRYVALAKRELSGVVGIDLFAGPSEAVVIGDRDSNPTLIAADLLAQAEHDPEAQVLLLTTSFPLARAVKRILQNQLAGLAEPAVASLALRKNGWALIARDQKEMVEFVRRLAPEHVALSSSRLSRDWRRFSSYGAMFFPATSCVAYGDYSSGLNHILPTASTARFSSGLSVRDFLRFPTALEIRRQSCFLRRMQKAAIVMAEQEGLEAHRRAVEMRLGRAEHGRK